MKSLSNTIIAAVIAVVLTLAVGLFLYLPFGAGLEAWMGDTMMTWRYELLKKTDPARKPDPHLVLAAIDQRSVEDLGRWPFPRSTHGSFLQLLAPEKPKAVAWDILFTERTSASSASGNADASSPAPDSTLQPDDQSLVDGVKLFQRLITGAERDSSGGPPLSEEDALPTRPLKNIVGDISKLTSASRALLPFPELRKVSYFGFVDDPGELRRTLPLVVNIGGKIFPSFDLQALMQYWAVDPDQVAVAIGREITLPRPDGTEARIPIDDSGQFIINYRARTEDFQALSYSVMGKGLDDKAKNQQSDERAHLPPITDNLVVVGVTLAGTDAGPIPIDPRSPLVITHLNVLNNILQHDYLHDVSAWIWLPIYALFLFGIGNAMLRVGTLPMIGIAVAAISLVGAIAFATLWFGNCLMPVLVPETGLLLLSIIVPSKGFFGEEREKTRIKNAMRACLSEKVMVKMLAHPDNIKLGGTKQEISVMFCDIRGFTRYCDERDPQETVEVLNEYMEEMSQVVFKYDGTIDKYIGDCIMAFWNAPESQPDHAQRAVCCAMDMRAALANFKTKRAGLDRELFECGIGIHTGEALVGMMGSSIKRNYTAMGSTVNMAARLETLTKRLNERILISQHVLDQLQGDFPLTDRGDALVPGFANPIHVYAVVADQDISAALKVGRALANQQEYKAEEASEPIWQPAPLPEDDAPNQTEPNP